MKAQKSVFHYRIRLCFHDYKLAIENDENDQSHRNIDYKMKRQKSIKQEVGCEFIGIDCEKEVFFFFRRYQCALILCVSMLSIFNAHQTVV